MRFETLEVCGAVLVRVEPHVDSRGLFARTYCVEEFSRAGLPTQYVQASTSFNAARGTVRGMHWQWPPSREAKLVRCVRGAICDVLLDLRPDSPTYLKHATVNLSQDNRDAVFVPHGVAHGFQALVDSTEVLYQMTDCHVAELAAGFRWNDSAWGIRWPISTDIVISERDSSYPDFDPTTFEAQWRRRDR